MSNYDIPHSLTADEAEVFGLLNRDTGSLADLQGDRERVTAAYCDCRLARKAALQATQKEQEKGIRLHDGSRGMVRVEDNGRDVCPFCGHFLFWKTHWVHIREGHVSTADAQALIKISQNQNGRPSAGRVNVKQRVD